LSVVDEQDPVTRGKGVQKYFSALIKSAVKWPTETWEKAWMAYERIETEKRTVNRWRTKVDTVESFVDEEPAKVRIEPAAPFQDDEAVKAQAEAKQAFYGYLYEECGFRETLRRVCHAAHIQNIAAVLRRVDKRRMLPTLEYLDVDDLRIDGACKGDLKKAGWVAWREMVAIDRLLMERPDLDKEALEKCAGDVGTVTAENASARDRQARDVTETSRRRVTRWRVFARNEHALYDAMPGRSGAEGEPHLERFRDVHGMSEPRRYLDLVEGYDVPLADDDRWPEAYALDWDEWPFGLLLMGRGSEPVLPPSDYELQRPLEAIHTEAFDDAKTSSRLGAGNKLGGPAGDAPTPEAVRDFVASDGVEYLPGAFSPLGQALIAPMNFGRLDDAQLKWLEVIQDQDEQQSGVPKIRMGAPGEYDTKYEAQVATDASTARANTRLAQFEDFQAALASEVLAMSQAVMRRLSAVEVTAETLEALQQNALAVAEQADVQTAMGTPAEYAALPPEGPLVEGLDRTRLSAIQAEKPILDGLTFAQVSALLRQFPDSQVLYLGIEALIGARHAEAWDEDLPQELARRMIRVVVERGSTQRRTRLEKVSMFVASWRDMATGILQAAMQAGGATAALEVQVEALQKVLELQGLAEFQGILAPLTALVEDLGRAQQAEAAAGVPPAGSEALP